MLLKEEILSLQKIYDDLKSVVENHDCKLSKRRIIFQKWINIYM